jgi:hypothetical protein
MPFRATTSQAHVPDEALPQAELAMSDFQKHAPLSWQRENRISN